MGFSYDGCKNGKGGRKAAVSNNKNLPQPGQPSNKSSKKNTVIAGMNFAAEALPPGLVLQTAAVNPMIRIQFLKYMKHVRGQFGYPPVDDDNDLKTFPVFISWSKDASVTSEIFYHYIVDHLMALYPDAEDVAGKRVIMKADSGPGRSDRNFLTVARARGFYFLPGLPNGTELGQEMDQLFAHFKSIMEANRELLYRTLFQLGGSNNDVDDGDGDNVHD